MSAFRPLPPRPSLEFERKEAKALLRRLRAGDADALARARARYPAIDPSQPERIRLADTQLVIAREYGFSSWPRLVRYFGDVERQRHSVRSARTEGRDSLDASVRSLIDEHRDRRAWTGRVLAAYVPRFYGKHADEIFASAVTEDDARLATARIYGFPSWEVLLERTAAARQRLPREWELDPMAYAARAMDAADLGELQRVVAAHPELLRPPDDDLVTGRSLIRSAVDLERRSGAALRPITEWLVAQGFDLQHELNRQLCGHMYMTTGEVRWLLERGADTRWVAPNGIPVLEHALIRYWNGEAVDLLATHTVPRKALWIAAGLGDVDGVRRSLDARGKPTPNARRLRPDWDAVGQRVMVPHPDPDDDEILIEAFVIAMLNGRVAVLEYMASRGFPLNTLAWGSPLVSMAVGNGMVPIVECLVRCGADLDLRGWRPRQSAREIARGMFVDNSHDPARRRIVELCGMDPDAVLAERDAREVEPPRLELTLDEALAIAGDDAFRLGQAEIGPENLLFGLLRSGGLVLDLFTKYSQMDLDRFRADVWARVNATEGPAHHSTLPLNADAQAMLESAVAVAIERRRETVTRLHLLYALLHAQHGPAADLLTRYGANVTQVTEGLERTL